MSRDSDPADAARRHAREQELFHAALESAASGRDAFVRAAAGDDSRLAERVLALLVADADGGMLLDRGLGEVATRVVAGEGGPLPRERFGPYRVTGLLGEGGMGVVYRGRRDDVGADAAIKVLRDATLSPARRERFAFEQRALAQLNHAAIAHLHDAGTLADGTPWFAMELVDGVPITDYCRTRGLNVTARLKLFRDVCEAVRHAHAHALLHRDLKPSNILVRPDGHVKLVDFGIAKPLDPLADPADATRTGLRLMTPAYAAPEQVLGGVQGVHTDVYSLGVVLYELLAGKLPFDLVGRTPSEAATVLTESTLARPSAAAAAATHAPDAHGISRDAWRDLDVLCLTAMHREATRRYATVDALVHDLDRYLAGEPLEARGDSWRYRAGKFARRHAGALALAALVVLVIAGLVTFYTLRLAAARDRALAATSRRAATQDLLVLLLQGDADAGPQDTLRVLTLLGRGEERARELTGQPELQAELERAVGGQEHVMGRLDRAETLLVRSLADTRRAPHPDPDDEVRSLIALAMLRADADRGEQAERDAREAVALVKRRLPDNTVQRANALGTLGHVLATRGELAQAVPVLEQALQASAPRGPQAAEWGWALTELANVHYYLGHLAESDSLNRLGLAFDRERLGPRHPNVAHDLANLGSSAQQRGRYAEAERDEREALAIARAWYGDGHVETASFAMTLASTLATDQRYAESESLLAGVLATYARAYGPDHVKMAAVYSVRANIEDDAKHWEQAIADYTRAAAIYRRAHGDHDGPLGVVLTNLGDVYRDSGDDRQAERWLRAALDAFSGAVEPGSVDPAITHVKLGRSLLHQERFAEAERETRTGYDVLVKQQSGGSSFLHAARKDLAAECDALGRHAEAARFRAELAAADSAAGAGK